MIRLLLVLALSGGLATASGQESTKPMAMGGAACVMAKWEGNTLDYKLVYGKGHPVEAQEEAERYLRDKGYGAYRFNRFRKPLDLISGQAVSNLPHAYVIVVKAQYKSKIGKDRTSYGCGFSAISYSEAQWAALRDLQSYSWGWHPNLGFEVVEQLRY